MQLSSLNTFTNDTFATFYTYFVHIFNLNVEPANIHPFAICANNGGTPLLFQASNCNSVSRPPDDMEVSDDWDQKTREGKAKFGQGYWPSLKTLYLNPEIVSDNGVQALE